MLGGGDSDKVVPVSSAYKPGVDSNRFIHAKHTKLHFVQAGVDELVRILRQHACQDCPDPASRPVMPTENPAVLLPPVPTKKAEPAAPR